MNTVSIKDNSEAQERIQGAIRESDKADTKILLATGDIVIAYGRIKNEKERKAMLRARAKLMKARELIQSAKAILNNL